MALVEKTYFVQDYVNFRDKVLKLSFAIKKIVIFVYIGFVPEQNKYKVVLRAEPELVQQIENLIRDGQLK
ncbi:MAG: hypothetical protein LM587_02625 [Candidatus Aenigmarchaeota archaeon]|nr:hypothetical protein [Candidatus Aenigmarchaeota archaeon]